MTDYHNIAISKENNHILHLNNSIEFINVASGVFNSWLTFPIKSVLKVSNLLIRVISLKVKRILFCVSLYN